MHDVRQTRNIGDVAAARRAGLFICKVQSRIWCIQEGRILHADCCNRCAAREKRHTTWPICVHSHVIYRVLGGVQYFGKDNASF